ncbi:SpoIID/LytB domain-containing protein [Nocardioides sp. URHA0020]|uniref:SpoIID/LytB domain-containing protein n=1 Tax=Nocardioides sp. URHA0020 TaxID=1380392 RepID=UPI000685524B|nr:SpoIID/LytB domain-containing protein [Nocardioides sp. URHA0020]
MLIQRSTASLFVTASLVGTALAAAPAQAAPERRGPSTVTITTTGWGHGKGLSQYGARNRARAGQSWQTIVRTYYPRTSWGRATGHLRVQITADTTRDVIVRPRSGLTVRSLGSRKTWRVPARVHGRKVIAWRILPAGHRSKVQYKTRSWHTWHTGRGDAQFTAGGAPIVLQTPRGRASYRGVLRSTSVNASGTSRDTVNVVPVEAYLRGVVPREVPASWPAAAVRAQAVAARTYAVSERRARTRAPYDLCDTASCQVYGGFQAEQPQSDAAVRATSRRVVLYGGRPVFAQFSSSNGGWSVDGGYPYLRAAEDRFDRGSAGDPTTRTFSAAAITRNWSGMGDLVSIKVTVRDGRGPYGGRARTVRVVGSNFTRTVSGDTFRSWLGLRSTLMRIT